MKRTARNKQSVQGSNPRQMVESWLLAGLSRPCILWILEAFHGFDSGQCRRLYSLVETEHCHMNRS
jgi:hypothetical protein